jgi:hypothetical protein
MMGAFTLPENCKIVKLFYGATNAAAAVTNVDVISCKNAQKVWVVGYHALTNGTTCVVSLYEATDVAGATNAAITATFPIWTVIPSTSTDALTRITDAASLTIDPDGADTSKLFVMEWDPVKFSAGYDCLTVNCATGHATDRILLLAFIQERYAQALAPSAIVD